MDTNTSTHRIPVRYSWIGGSRAGYVLYDNVGVKICRVWSETDAKFAVYCGYAKPKILVDV